jgi:hypothetical protein
VADRKWLPTTVLTTLAAVAVALLASFLLMGELAVSSQDCPMESGRQKIGPLPYMGEDGNQFEYEADASSDGKFWYYQVAIKNTGKEPLTVDWPKPSYFRRGIRPQTVAPGQCLADGNSPNQDVDTIRYGPNTQFTGPKALFYRPAPSTEARQTGVSISFDAHLDRAQVVAVRISLVSLLKSANRTIGYTLNNKGSSVRIRWKAIEGPIFYDAARVQLGVDVLSLREKGILVPQDKVSVVDVSAIGALAKRILQVLDILTPDGVLIYRDLAPAFTFDKISPYGWVK